MLLNIQKCKIKKTKQKIEFIRTARYNRSPGEEKNKNKKRWAEILS